MDMDCWHLVAASRARRCGRRPGPAFWTAADLPGPHGALISCVHTAVRTNLAKNACVYLSQTSQTNESSLGAWHSFANKLIVKSVG